jgi:hypothetical protein
VGPTAVVVGMITAPTFITASIVSHSATWLPSITTTASPLTTPCAVSQRASRLERRRMSSKVTVWWLPSVSTITSAGWELSRAISSNQSTAQLKESPTSGQRNARTAAS